MRRGSETMPGFVRLIALVVFVGVLCPIPFLSSALGQLRVGEADFPGAIMARFSISQGQSATIDAVGQGVADPVCHLYRQGASSWAQVAFNDNYRTSLNCRIAYTNTSGYTSFILLVRSKTYSTGGPVTVTATIGGTYYSGPTIDVRSVQLPSSVFVQTAGNVLHTAELPGGSLWSAVFPCSSTPWPGSTDPYSYGLSPYLAGGPAGTVSGPASGNGGYIFVTPQILEDVDADNVFEVTYARSGHATIYINVVGTDSDADGVGNGLEAAVGTCSGVGTCQYAMTVNTKDTDNDGLPDNEELFGVEGNPPDPGNPGADLDDVSFPRWGADPLHKDVFLQTNYFMTTPSTPNPFAAMTPAQLDAWVDNFVAVYGEGDDADVGNPDGLDGIAVHLDLGVAPPDSAREQFYGDFPHLSSRGEPAFYSWTFTQAVSSPPPNGWDGDYWFLVSASPTQWGQWEFNSTDAGGSTPSNLATYVYGLIEDPVKMPPAWGVHGTLDDGSVSIEKEDPAEADELFAWLFCRPTGSQDWSLCSILGLTVEGNNLVQARRNHFSNPNYFDSVRQDRFFYASVTQSGGGQGPVVGRTLVAGINSIDHELGHCLGLEDGGSPAPGYEEGFSNCPPNYDSLMSYTGGDSFYTAAPTVAFGLNPAAVNDLSSAPTDSCGLADRVEAAPWNFYVQETGGPPPTDCDVDWNRTGSFESSNYQAAIGMSQGDSCNTFSQGRQFVVESGHTALSYQATARGGGYLYIVGIEDVSGTPSLTYRRAALGSGLSSPCTGPFEACLSFFSRATLVSNVSAVGVAAYYWDNKLFVAYPQASDNTVRIRRYTIGTNGALTFSVSRTIQSAAGESLEFVVRYNGTSSPELILLWGVPLGGSGFYVFSKWNNATLTWSEPEVTPLCGGGIIYGFGTPAAVAWPDPYNSSASYAYRKTCSLFPDADSAALLFCYDAVGQCWKDETPFAFPSSSGSCPGRHVDRVYNVLGVDISFCVPEAVKPLDLAFVPVRYASGSQASPSQGKGNLYLVFYADGSGCGGNFAPAVWISEQVSQASPIDQNFLWGGVKSSFWRDFFSNLWGCLQVAGNLSLCVDETMGTAMASGSYFYEGAGRLNFYPYADGSPSRNYLPLSDFITMGEHVCTSVRGSDLSGLCE